MQKRRPVVIREKSHTLEELAKMSGFTQEDVRELIAMAHATRRRLEAERAAAQNAMPAADPVKPSKPRRRPAA